MTEEERVNEIHVLAHQLVADSFVNDALARYTFQIVRFMHDEYIAPLRKENGELRKQMEDKPMDP